MKKCLICGKEFESNKKFELHILPNHGITAKEYKEKFDLTKRCLTCGKVLLKNNKSGYCNSHRNRTGENNPFYGKHHSDKTKKGLQESSRKGTIKNWQNEEYRKKVITNKTGVERTSEFKETQKRNAHKQFEDLEQRKLRSEKMKQSWSEGKIEVNINSINESKREKNLREEVSKITKLKVEKKQVKGDKRFFLPDIIIDNKIIIEFYGDYWHANPKKYKENDIIHHNKSAKEIYEEDKERIKQLKELGYEIYIIWQEDYDKDKNKVIEGIKKIILEYENKVIS